MLAGDADGRIFAYFVSGMAGVWPLQGSSGKVWNFLAEEARKRPGSEWQFVHWNDYWRSDGKGGGRFQNSDPGPEGSFEQQIWEFVAHGISPWHSFLGEPQKDFQMRDDVIRRLKDNNVTDKDFVVIVGYSLGGESVLKLSRELADEGITIDVLATIDAVSSGTPVEDNHENVRRDQLGFRWPIGTHKVQDHVEYFFNRWQTVYPWPIDTANGQVDVLSPSKTVSDQKEYNHFHDSKGKRKELPCSEVDRLFNNCTVYLFEDDTTTASGHSRINRDPWVQRELLEVVKKQLAADEVKIEVTHGDGTAGLPTIQDDGARQVLNWDVKGNATGVRFRAYEEVIYDGNVSLIPLASHANAPTKGSFDYSDRGLGKFRFEIEADGFSGDSVALATEVVDDDVHPPVAEIEPPKWIDWSNGGFEIDLPDNSILDTERREFRWNVSDPSGLSSVEVELTAPNGSDIPVPDVARGEYDFTLRPPGLYTLRITAEDNDSDRSSDREKQTIEHTVRVRDDDSFPPRLELTTASGQPFLGEGPKESHGVPNRVFWQATDSSGLARAIARIWKNGTLLTTRSLDVDNQSPISLDGLGIGNFVVEVTVDDADDDGWSGDSLSTTRTARMTITNDAPTVFAGGPYLITEGQMLQLDAVGSDRDLDLSAASAGPGNFEELTYAWDLDGDGQFDDASGDAPVITWDNLVTLGLDDDGNYPVRARVTDRFGATGEASAIITVMNAPPLLESFVSEPFIDENTTHVVNGVFVDPSPADTHEVLVHWGDGTSTPADVDTASRTFSASHHYVDDDPTGTGYDEYVIRVELTDDDGGIAPEETRQLPPIVIDPEHADFRAGNIVLPSFPLSLPPGVSGLLKEALVEVDPLPADTTEANGQSFYHNHIVDYPKNGPFDLEEVTTSAAPAVSTHRHYFNIPDIDPVTFTGSDLSKWFLKTRDQEFGMNPRNTTAGATWLPDGYEHQHSTYDPHGYANTTRYGVTFTTKTKFTYDREVFQTIVDTEFNSRPSNVRYTGDAYVGLSGSTQDRILRLTNTNQHQKGSLVVDSVGHAHREFEASFQIYVGGGVNGGADGFSFGYAPLSNNSTFGEKGVSGQPGLWVGFDTWVDNQNGMRIYYEGKLLKYVPIARAKIRMSSYVDFEVTMDDDGDLVVRHPALSGGQYGMRVPGWNPKADWRFGVGARTGYASDHHAIDSLYIRAKYPKRYETGTYTRTGVNKYILPDFPYTDSTGQELAGYDLVSVDVEMDIGGEYTSTVGGNPFNHEHTFGKMTVGPFSFTGPTTTEVTSSSSAASAKHGHAVDYAPNSQWFTNDSDLRSYFLQETATYLPQGKVTSSKVLNHTHDLAAGTVPFQSTITFKYDVARTIVRARNVAPEITSLDLVPLAVENSTVRLEGAFADEGVGDTHRVAISWGDGTSQELTVPAGGRHFAADHQYLDDAPSGTAEDAYAVRVTVLDDDGGSDAQTLQLTLRNEPPQLTLAPSLPVAEGSVFLLPTATFTDRGPLDTHTASVQWGDETPPDTATVLQGAGAGIVSARHVYRDEGTYPLQVTLRDDDTGEVTQGQTITVFNVAPTVVDLRALGPVIEGLGVTLRATATDPGDDTVTFTWDFGDGTPSESGVELAEVNHVFAHEGAYTVTLSVDDGDGGTAGRQLTVLVSDIATAVSVAGPATIAEGGDYPLALSTLTDEAAASISRWIVDWGDGTSNEYSSAGLVTHRYADGPASHTIRIDIDQSSGGISPIGELPVSVENTAPRVTSLARVAGPPPREGQTLSFAATAVDAGTDTLTYTWDFGDGTPARNGVDLNAVQHAYADDGTYVVTLIVRDEDGQQAVAGLPVVIDNEAPAVTIGGAEEAIEGTPYQLTLGTISDPGDDTVTGWIVDWGDGRTVHYDQGGVVSHAYPEGPAGHSIQVALEDEDGLHPFQPGPSVTVRNDAPLVHRINGSLRDDEGKRFSFSAEVTDPGGAFDVLTFAWDFGDGASEQGVNLSDVQHIYVDDGTYDASLTVSDEEGGRTVFPFTVTVDNVAPASILSGPASVQEGVAYTLKFGPTLDPGTDTVTHWIVDWGDGQQSTLSAPVPVSHSYTDGPATPTIVLKLVDEDGTHAPAATLPIEVRNAAPEIIDVGGDTFGSEGELLQFSASASDPGDDPLEFTWDFGDGSPTQVGVGLTTVAHAYADNGEYLVEVTVNDGDAGRATGYIAVTVENVAPIIGLTGAAATSEGDLYELTLGDVMDPGADSVTAWMVGWGDGTVATYSSAGTVTHRYADGPDAVEISVALVDDDGVHGGAASHPVMIENLPPTITQLTAPEQIREGHAAIFSVSTTDPAGDLDELTATWDFGDGTPPTTKAASEAVAHTFADDGQFTVHVTVTDGDGGEVSRQLQVSVDNVGPTIELDGDSLTEEAGVYTLTLGEVLDPGQDVVTQWIVDWGDGAQSTYGSAGQYDHTYADGPSNPIISVSLTDEDGTHLAGQEIVTVDNVDPNLWELSGPEQAQEGAAVAFSASARDVAGDNDTLTYIWDFGDGSDPLTGIDRTDVTHVFADEGSYDVVLQVNDEDGGTAFNFVIVEIANVAPAFEAGPDETILPPSLGQFNRTLQFVDPGAPDIHDVTIDYGDGSEMHEFTLSNGERGFELDHKFEQSGTFTIRITLADRDGGTHTDSFDLTVILAEIEFTSATFVDPEGTGTSTVVTLERNSAVVESQVEVAITGGSAIAGIDYDASAFPLIVTFPVDAFTATVPLPVAADGLVELDETVTFVVNAVQNATIVDQNTTTLTIANDDTAAVTIHESGYLEGDSGTSAAVFDVTISNPVDRPLTVVVNTQGDIALGGGVDFQDVDDHTVTFAPGGSLLQTFTVELVGDTEDEGDETFRVQLSDPEFDGATDPSRATIAVESAIGVVENDDLGDRQPINIVDNGDAAFSFGGFTFFGHGYLNDLHYTDGDSSGDTARWTFDNLLPGLYRVSATWTHHPTRATDAPYTLRDGDTAWGTVRVDQEVPPDDFSDAGASWEDLGPYVKITSGTLTVELSDDADQVIAADAIRVELLTLLSDYRGELTVLHDGHSLVSGDLVDLGASAVPITEELTVRNEGGESLTLGQITSSSSHFFGAGGNLVLPPGASTTITLGMSDTETGTHEGTLHLASDDADEDPFVVAVSGEVYRFTTQVIDNGEPGFDSSGFTYWPFGYQGDLHYAAGDSSGDAARWTFRGLPVGLYRVAATWSVSNDRATDAPYRLRDGESAAFTFPIDQRQSPDDANWDGRGWEDLGPYVAVRSGTLIVELGDQANGRVDADAVRIELLTTLADGQPELQLVGETGSPVAGNVESGDELRLGTIPAPTTYVFQVRNEGDAPLNVGDVHSSSSDFSIAVGADQIAPGGQTSLTITTAATALGSLQGTIVIPSNDADEPAFTVTLLGEVQELQILDDGDTRFSATSGFRRWFNQGYQNDVQEANPGATQTATWTFDELPEGVYRVSATWSAYYNRATNAAYSINGGDVVAVNQRKSPQDPSSTPEGTVVRDPDSGVYFADLTIAARPEDGTIVVQLSNQEVDGNVIADAIRLERLGPLHSETTSELVTLAGHVTRDEVTPVVDAAIRYWSTIDASAADRLRDVEVVIRDLPERLLGLASPLSRTIWLDDDGGRFGWNVTPTWSSVADSSYRPATATVDLLTVVMHELGHLLDLPDLDPLAHPDALMAATLPAGRRRMPEGVTHDGRNLSHRPISWLPTEVDSWFEQLGRREDSEREAAAESTLVDLPLMPRVRFRLANEPPTVTALDVWAEQGDSHDELEMWFEEVADQLLDNRNKLR